MIDCRRVAEMADGAVGASVPDDVDDLDDLNEPAAQSSPANPFDPSSPTAGAAASVAVSSEDLRVLLAQMGAATRAASEAASAAARAVQTKAGIGAGDMSKILPRPDVFSPKNREEEHSQWMNWLWSLKQYMTALDTEYSTDFARIEAYSTVAIDVIANPEAMQRSQRLYALLAGLVRGRGLQII